MEAFLQLLQWRDAAQTRELKMGNTEKMGVLALPRESPERSGRGARLV